MILSLETPATDYSSVQRSVGSDSNVIIDVREKVSTNRLTFVHGDGKFALEGQSGTYQFKLASEPTSKVTVSIAGTCSNTYMQRNGQSNTLYPPSFSFDTKQVEVDPADWTTLHTVTFESALDGTYLNYECVFIHSFYSEDPAYGLADMETLQFTLHNVETVRLLFGETSPTQDAGNFTVIEDTGVQSTSTVAQGYNRFATVYVSLNLRVPLGATARIKVVAAYYNYDAPFNIRFTNEDGSTYVMSESSNTGAILTFTDENWDQPQPVLISAPCMCTVHPFSFLLAPPSSY